MAKMLTLVLRNFVLPPAKRQWPMPGATAR
jgi:hypothetical protein